MERPSLGRFEPPVRKRIYREPAEQGKIGDRYGRRREAFGGTIQEKFLRHALIPLSGITLPVKSAAAVLLWLPFPVAALTVGDTACVHSVLNNTPCAVIYGNAEVGLAYSKNSSRCIELQGYVDPEDILAGRLALTKTTLVENAFRTVIREVTPVDTIYLFRDTALSDTIGYAWGIAERNALTIKNASGKQSRLAFSLFGLVDSSELVETTPRDKKILHALLRQEPFNRDAAEFVPLFGFKDTATLDVRFEYIYGDAAASNRIESVWVFKFGKLKAVWTQAALDGLNKMVAGEKCLYFCDDSRCYIDKVKNDIIGRTLANPGLRPGLYETAGGAVPVEAPAAPFLNR
jgi:hypothetical protein